ncbi:hypothetical protein LCGC14_0825630 [marine sediment metagenome]|uniref:Heparan-alpha-glucosaminide N-acetyltransferase catalytic domain-containing protein n=1 Tax=marine sediment metagenome TaxID=412755 RepID=A0A0F9PMA2_9ZZZZ
MSEINEEEQNSEISTLIKDGKNSSSTQRIASIDFVKGLAMGFIIFAHAALFWLDKDWRYIYGLVFAFLDILGPSVFVFLSALSVVFSIKRKKRMVSEKVIRNRIFTRGFIIIIVGVLFNPISLLSAGKSIPFPANLWGWNFLMFIGFSQIFSYYALKFNKITRAIISPIVIFISPWIRQLLFYFKDLNWGVNILHFIITSPLPQVPFLPWIAVCFISTIFGEYLYEAMMKGTEEAYYKLFRKFLIYGIILIVIGVFIIVPRGLAFNQWEPGWALQTEETIEYSEYLHIDLLRIANQQDYYPFPGMPLFMIRSTAQNMFYNLGAALLIIAICFYYIDIKKKNNDAIKMLIFFGKVSLSLFLIQYFFDPLYVGQFSIVFAPFVIAAYCGFLGLLLYVWVKFFNGVGSPEWMMRKIGKKGQKKGKPLN